MVVGYRLVADSGKSRDQDPTSGKAEIAALATAHENSVHGLDIDMS